ncbi:MAG: M55 family metallopeptidase [Clostridia bacterium]|nr:M55 family metallopeptidase [Clostridia bacterium]
MNILICVDLEGIHGVVGERYQTLTHSCDYKTACEGAVYEINTVARALFDKGAEQVYVWDNHGGGGNIDTSLLDKRITPVSHRGYLYRGDFAKALSLSGVIFLGYHAKEGTPMGVLAHTFSSVGIQYVKLGGTPIGELFVDTHIFADLGVKTLLHAGDDISCNELKGICPDAVCVVTKRGRGRNNAYLRERGEVLDELYSATCASLSLLDKPVALAFPDTPETLEVRYTRAERAEDIMRKAGELGIPARWGDDTHILLFEVTSAKQIPSLL